MHQTAATIAIEEHAATVDDLRAAIASARILGIQHHLILKPLGSRTTNKLLQFLRGRLQSFDIVQIDVHSVLAADIIAEAAPHAVHVVGELEDPRVDPVDLCRWHASEAVGLAE